MAQTILEKKNCLIQWGSTEGLSTFIRTFVAEGDEVIMPLPTYPGYAPNIKCKRCWGLSRY